VIAAAALALSLSTARGLTPEAVLANYAVALAKQERPKAVSFVYQVEQLGPRNMAQTHRVYRAGRNERDETLIVDGVVLERPAIRILADRIDRYAVAAVAPRLGAYTFTFESLERGPNGYTFIFRTEPHGAARFAVSEVAIDGRSFLPVSVRFTLSGNGAHGTGELLYGRAEGYWLVREARVSAHLADGSIAREDIAWSNYQFPPALPPSTFLAPRASITPSQSQGDLGP
jgi:hypothetical protein